MESGKSALLIIVVQFKVFISKLYFAQGFREQLQIRGLIVQNCQHDMTQHDMTGTDGLILKKVCMLI